MLKDNLTVEEFARCVVAEHGPLHAYKIWNKGVYFIYWGVTDMTDKERADVASEVEGICDWLCDTMCLSPILAKTNLIK